MTQNIRQKQPKSFLEQENKMFIKDSQPIYVCFSLTGGRKTHKQAATEVG